MTEGAGKIEESEVPELSDDPRGIRGFGGCEKNISLMQQNSLYSRHSFVSRLCRTSIYSISNCVPGGIAGTSETGGESTTSPSIYDLDTATRIHV
jgi:hypothetical protein